LASGEEPPERAVVLTFDDGYEDFHDNALPEIERRGFTATVFVTTGWMADGGVHAAGKPLDRMMTCSQVRAAADTGIEVAAHSHSHAQLDQLADGALHREVWDCKTILEGLIGQPVQSFAYPYGYFSCRARAAVVAAGYRSAAVVSNAIAHPRNDRFALPRLTIRRATDLSTFDRIVRSEGIGWTFVVDRALSTGWKLARRGRSLARKLL
jgi:peptidoglycan/xylan/chitin deacetylase (PgdA/CDA1 family)